MYAVATRKRFHGEAVRVTVEIPDAVHR